MPTRNSFDGKTCRELLHVQNARSGAWPLRGATQYLYVASDDTALTQDGDSYQGGAITIFPNGEATAIRTINSGSVRAVTADARYIYAAQMYDCKGQGPGAVLVYNKATGLLLRTLKRSINAPVAFATDSQGNIFVDNIRGKVAVYAPGGSRLLRTISQGVELPVAIAIDRSDNLYVANQWTRHPDTVTVYRGGGVHLSRTIYTDGGPSDLALDFGNNLYVAGINGNSVTVYSAGTSHILRVMREGMDDPGKIGISRGLLYVGNAGGSTGVYALASGKLLRKIPAEGTRLAFDRLGRAYISTWKAIKVYAPGGTRLIRTFDKAGANVTIDPQ